MCTENPSIERTSDPGRPVQIARIVPRLFGHDEGAPPLRGWQGWVSCRVRQLARRADGLLDEMVAAIECQGLASNGFTSPQSEPNHLPVIVVRELRGVSPTFTTDDETMV
jgi:hypothetical protein